MKKKRYHDLLIIFIFVQCIGNSPAGEVQLSRDKREIEKYLIVRHRHYGMHIGVVTRKKV